MYENSLSLVLSSPRDFRLQIFFLVANNRAPGPVIISNLYLTECKCVLNTAFTPAASTMLPLLNQKNRTEVKNMVQMCWVNNYHSCPHERFGKIKNK